MVAMAMAMAAATTTRATTTTAPPLPRIMLETAGLRAPQTSKPMRQATVRASLLPGANSRTFGISATCAFVPVVVPKQSQVWLQVFELLCCAMLCCCSYLDPEKAKNCDDGLNAVGTSDVYIGGQGRVCYDDSLNLHTGSPALANTSPSPAATLLVNSFYSGAANADRSSLPLVRWVAASIVLGHVLVKALGLVRVKLMPLEADSRLLCVCIAGTMWASPNWT